MLLHYNTLHYTVYTFLKIQKLIVESKGCKKYIEVKPFMYKQQNLFQNKQTNSKKNSQSLIYFYFEGISFRLISGFNERAVSLCWLQEGWHTFLPRLLDSCPLISAWSTSALNTIRDLWFFTPTSFGSTLIIDLSSSCKPCFSLKVQTLHCPEVQHSQTFFFPFAFPRNDKLGLCF